jgi:hypothetical protein
MPFALNDMTLSGLCTLAAICLSTILVMSTILSPSDIAVLRSVMICCTIVATVSLLEELGVFTNRPVFGNPYCGRYCCTGCQTLTHLSAVPVVDGVECVNAVQLRRTALVKRT